jgi:hypothetical protein
MSEHEEKIEALQEYAQEEANVVEEKVDAIIKEETEKAKDKEMEALKAKCEALEALAGNLKASMPNISQIGRPIHLNVVSKGFLFQLLIPEQALNNLEHFADVHAIISKFGALISEMEKNATEAIKKAEAEKATK